MAFSLGAPMKYLAVAAVALLLYFVYLSLVKLLDIKQNDGLALP